ncbi:MAG: metal-dependent hydrolase [Candidatus Moranbacteria bacterium]|nr:metal-dependent hydrolase [Candidatus Moranbacteria bacterium]
MFLDLFFAFVSAFIVGSIFKEEFSLFWVSAAMLASIFPDIDGVWEYYERGRIWGKDWKRHRISFFHYPIFYAPFFLITFFFIPLSCWVLILVNLSFHFLHDIRSGEVGIRLFYPFSRLFFALHRKNNSWIVVKRTEKEIVHWLKESGNNHWIRDYFKNFWAWRLLGFLIILGGYLIITRGYYPITSADLWEIYYKFQKPPTIKTDEAQLITTTNNINSDSDGNYFNELTAIKNNETGNTNSQEEPKKEQANTALPDFVNNHTTFISQAPLANWDNLHEEACEEAALLISHYYLSNKKNISPKEAEKDIQDLSAYTKNIYPKKDDMNLEELKMVAQDKFGYANWEIIDNPTTSYIQKELLKGNDIIMPLAGREINNPNFKRPGPLYHMLVVSGYNQKKEVFITQDPGTRKGKNYEYKFNVLIKALHDFPGKKEEIKKGLPKILVIKK